MPRKVKLLEVFKDVNPVIRGMSGQGHYTTYFQLIPKCNHGMDRLELLGRIEKYVESLRQKYPEKEFYHYTCKIDGKEYVVITKKKYIVDKDGRKVRQWDRCPIYICLEDFKVYIPEYYYKVKRKLCSYILLRALGTLGLATVRNLGRLPPKASS